MTGDYYKWEITPNVQACFISSNKKNPDHMMTSQARVFKINKAIFHQTKSFVDKVSSKLNN